ncbi:hypothetical protein K439DRAFT_1623697 [Ramaria rubella]|nr:hypothetical protein K439DRAFT_1623697 [Ramaria rubella]
MPLAHHKTHSLILRLGVCMDFQNCVISNDEKGIELDLAVAAYISSLALFVYDHLLVFPREIELIWRGPYHYTSVLYLITRAGSGAIVCNYCELVLHIVDAMGVLAFTTTTWVMVAQTYAMYDRNRVMLALMGALGLAILVLDSFQAAKDTCNLELLNDIPLRTIFLLVALTLFSSAVMTFTMYKILGIIRRHRRALGGIQDSSLTSVIFLESLCMMCVCPNSEKPGSQTHIRGSGVSLLRVVGMLAYVVSLRSSFRDVHKLISYLSLGQLVKNTLDLVVNPFSLPVSAIFVSRFLLNLRDVKHPTNLADTGLCPDSSSDDLCIRPVFTSFPPTMSFQGMEPPGVAHV